MRPFRFGGGGDDLFGNGGDVRGGQTGFQIGGSQHGDLNAVAHVLVDVGAEDDVFAGFEFRTDFHGGLLERGHAHSRSSGNQYEKSVGGFRNVR